MLRTPGVSFSGCLYNQVGVGNSDVGRTTEHLKQIVSTSAIQTHMRYVDELQLINNMFVPEVPSLSQPITASKSMFL